MASTHPVTIPAHDARPLSVERSDTLVMALLALTGAAAALSFIGWALNPQHFYFSYLTAYTFTLTLGLGSLFWIIVHHLTDAGWSVVIRRRFENVAAMLLLWPLLFVPIAIGTATGDLYDWVYPSELDAVLLDASPEEAAHLALERDLLAKKRAYLNPPFFAGRMVLYFLVWGVLAWNFTSWSYRQDESGDVSLTVDKMQHYAGIALLALALTSTFAAFDLIMSLTFSWFSTIFGVYTWAGAIGAAMALQTITTLTLRSQGLLRTSVTEHHLHDMGKLLFGLTVFWTYIAFAQYFLIWYANMPEETQFYVRRQAGLNPMRFLTDPGAMSGHAFSEVFQGWYWLTVLLVLGHFVIPFFFLMSKTIKRLPVALGAAAIWIVGFHYLDHYWMVMPRLNEKGIDWNWLWLDLSCLVTLGGALLLTVLRGLRTQSLLPVRDPRLAESLRFENVL